MPPFLNLNYNLLKKNSQNDLRPKTGKAGKDFLQTIKMNGSDGGKDQDMRERLQKAKDNANKLRYFLKIRFSLCLVVV